MNPKLTEAMAPLRARYEQLAPRERLLVTVAGVALGLFLLQNAVWKPAVAARARAEAELVTAREIATTLEQARAEALARGPQAGAQMIGTDVSLLSAVDQAAKSGTLSKPPSRLQPEGDDQARVWLEDVQFDQLVRWLYELQQRYGITIDVVDIERQPTAGLVNARLSLSRKR